MTPTSPWPSPAAARAAAKGFRNTSFFAPRRVALLADLSVPEAAVLARNLARGGFRGDLRSVGHRWDGIGGVDALEDLPSAPDLAVLALPPGALDAAAAGLAARGCRAMVVPAEAPDLAAVCARHGMRAIGARSFGLCVPALGLDASVSHLPLRPGRIALLCQSRALARVVIDWAAGEDLGFSVVCGIGDNADYGFAGALDWLSGDATTGVVLLDLFRIKNRRAFLSAARAAARTRPVIAVRAGRGAGDAAGEDEATTADAVMDAVLRRAGVLRVGGMESLLAAAETLARQPPGARSRAGAGDRVMVVSNGRGPAELAADSVRAAGLRLAGLPEAGREMLRLGLPPGWRGANPVVLPPNPGPALAEAAAMLAGLREVDTVVAIHAPEEADDGATVAALTATPRKAAPILVGWLGQATAGAQRSALAGRGLPVFATPEAAVRGALHLAQDRRNRVAAAELPVSDVLEISPDRDGARAVLDAARAEGRVGLTEAEALAVLGCYGVPVVPHRVARSPGAAADAAAALGFPVVLKLLSPDLDRKTAFGGVVLGLADAAAVRDAAAVLLARGAALPGAPRIDGLLVQRQAAAGTELRLRLGEDAMFGPWIGFGAGGTTADLAADESVDLPPLNLALARALVDRTRVSRRLGGWRDHAPADLDAVADALVRLSQLAVDFSEIRSAAVNPLSAGPTGVLALDAELTLRHPGEAAGVLAIAPYPAALARPWTAGDGREVVVRPIRPEDAEAHAAAFRRLPAEDVRRRFFAPLRQLPAAQTARLTSIDYDREMAFVAVQAGPGPTWIAGVARLVRGDGGGGSDAGEFAVVVDPAWKGAGLGRHLMHRLLDWARENGVRRMHGQVLPDNAPMVAFTRKLGFALHRGAEDALEATLDLEPTPGA